MNHFKRKDIAPMAKPLKKIEVTVPLGIFIFGLLLSLLAYFFLVIQPTESEKIVMDEPGTYELALSNAGSYHLTYKNDQRALFGWLSPSMTAEQSFYGQIDHGSTGETLQTWQSSNANGAGGERLAHFQVEEAGNYMLTLDGPETISATYVITPDVSDALSVVYQIFIATLMLSIISFAVVWLCKKWKRTDPTPA